MPFKESSKLTNGKYGIMVKSISKLTVFYPGQATGGGASNGPKEEHHQMIFILLNEPVLAFKFQISRGQLK